ncbi:MAG: type IV toxin-antitoxin system AbiEi family antitoxin domain-containing protein [Planctomycetota bacterium]
MGTTTPDWDSLYQVAASQDGYFTPKQSQKAGYSPQLLNKYIHSGKLVHIRRGVYRIIHFPPSDHEDLTVIWLWSHRQGVFSHETALALHELSDVLPKNIHLTLPSHDFKRRLRVPSGVELHFGDISGHHRQWFGCVPITSPAKALNDCATAFVSPDLLFQAVAEGRARGLFRPQEISPTSRYLSEFDE